MPCPYRHVTDKSWTGLQAAEPKPLFQSRCPASPGACQPETVSCGWLPDLPAPGLRVLAEGEEPDPRLEGQAGQVDLTPDITPAPQWDPCSETGTPLPSAWTQALGSPSVSRCGWKGHRQMSECPEAGNQDRAKCICSRARPSLRWSTPLR